MTPSKPLPSQPKKKSGNETVKKTLPLRPKGMHDVLPNEWRWWNHVYEAAEEIADFYNFGRIETPIVEHTELFTRAVGEGTDIVEKEMYSLKTRGGDALTLRPEGTAPVVRAYLEHGLSRVNPLQKLWYRGPMFRHEKPQLGRYRQFYQIGFEVIGGVSDPFYDAEVIQMFWRLLEELKIKGVLLKVNSIGCRVCRPNYVKLLQAYYRPRLKDVCEDCKMRFEQNPLRLLDCKEEQCQSVKLKAPNFYDKLCVACSRHLKGVLEYLEEVGIPYSLDNFLVRGLDYYSRTVFEMYVQGAGAEMKALPAGGRYDYLFESLGGRPTPAVGAAVGVERLVEVMKAQEIMLPAKKGKRIFVVHVGELAKKKLVSVIEMLRKAGIPIAEALGRESLKAQLKVADREHLGFALILGQQEIFEENVILRDLKTGVQETIPLSRMVEEVRKRIK